MKLTKEKTVGFVGSAIICGLIIGILSFIFLQTEIKATEEGILVNFGTVDWAAGAFEPRPEGENRVIPTEETSPRTETPKTEDIPPVITQDVEQTVAINDKKKKEEQRLEQERKNAEQKRIADEQRKRAQEEQRKRDAINQQVSGAFGAGNTPNGNEGTASSGTGNQGSAQGNAAVGSYVGVGGYGGFDLTGRTLGSGGLPRPAYSVQEEGRIVINITVDTKGNVISAEIGRGTNITSNTMRNSALEAARKAKFNTITGNNNQTGTITYNYKLN